MERYRSRSHSRFDLKYHFVWIPKYRKAILSGEVGIRVRCLVRAICRTLGIEILEGSAGLLRYPDAGENPDQGRPDGVDRLRTSTSQLLFEDSVVSVTMATRRAAELRSKCEALRDHCRGDDAAKSIGSSTIARLESTRRERSRSRLRKTRRRAISSGIPRAGVVLIFRASSDLSHEHEAVIVAAVSIADLSIAVLVF